MKLNRNHYFFLGMVLLLLGLQFRFVESYVLNAQSTSVIDQYLSGPQPSSPYSAFTSLIPTQAAPQLRTVTPPKFIGWALLSVGAILILHSIAMPKVELPKP
ncbi:MAG: hypothetical protein HYS13_19005 [Planctomycetia bacterium]|nr:hypothetical protein [Planctomycetia bacterium]